VRDTEEDRETKRMGEKNNAMDEMSQRIPNIILLTP